MLFPMLTTWTSEQLLDLAERTGDRFLRTAFATAQSCHSKFYNDWTDQEHLETYLPDIQHLVYNGRADSNRSCMASIHSCSD